MAQEIFSENFRKVWKFSIWFPDQKRKRRGKWLLSRYWGVMLEIYHYSLIIIVTFIFGRTLLSFPLRFILIYFVPQNIFKKVIIFIILPNILHNFKPPWSSLWLSYWGIYWTTFWYNFFPLISLLVTNPNTEHHFSNSDFCQN